MAALHTLLVLVIGAFTGLLGGAFGKGGSAIATPLLHAAGVPALKAVASPLPATIPATIIAALAYARAGQIDRRVLKLTVAAGVPATIAGAALTGAIGGAVLVAATEIVVAGLGIWILAGRAGGGPRPIEGAVPVAPSPACRSNGAGAGPTAPPLTLGSLSPTGVGRDARAVASMHRTGPGTGLGVRAGTPGGAAVVIVGLIVGLVSGLLGNSGGFLLAPLFATLLGLPLKRALGTSLAAAAFLAVPGTIVHAAMGHIDWSVAITFGLASVPLSATGARLALRADTGRLEVLYGAALLILGGTLLLLR